jgi:exodeoxyribonuclease VII small subunit
MAKTAAKKAHEAQGPQPDFEAALARLEEIVEKLDDGNLPLAQSLALFKEGTALAKRCRDLLSAAVLAVKDALQDVRTVDEDDFHGEEAGEDEDGA